MKWYFMEKGPFSLENSNLPNRYDNPITNFYPDFKLNSPSHHHHHHRLYNPGLALASSSKCRQWPLCCASASQFLQFSFLASSTPSVYLRFGRPFPHRAPEFVHSIILGNSFSSICTTWTTHLSLPDFITKLYWYISSSNCLLYLFCHCPLLHIRSLGFSFLR